MGGLATTTATPSAQSPLWLNAVDEINDVLMTDAEMLANTLAMIPKNRREAVRLMLLSGDCH
eukprot:11485140-Heterocapsa_arctica.AAC.1